MKDNEVNNIIAFTGETYLDIPADKVLNAALDSQLDIAVVIGRDADGRLYFASSSGDAAEVLLMLEIAKLDVMDGVMNG